MNMKDGRPQQNGLAAVFINDTEQRNTNSLTIKDEVHGFCSFLGAVDNKYMANGYGKSFLLKGRVFIGNYYENTMKNGKLYELQNNGNFSLFQVEYDYVNDKKNKLTVYS